VNKKQCSNNQLYKMIHHILLLYVMIILHMHYVLVKYILKITAYVNNYVSCVLLYVLKILCICASDHS